MRLLRSLATAALLIAAVTSPVRSELVVFGDSLSDTGNLFFATCGSDNPAGPFGPNGPFPTPPYFQGRHSNGPVFVEYLAEALGASAAPGTTGGTNFAFGFAETGVGLSTQGSPNVGAQIDMFFGSGRTFSGSELVVLYAGANDILFGG
ncbi:hypothetical protein BH23PLA1_BH23PLA1_18560 [soil metagenome]